MIQQHNVMHIHPFDSLFQGPSVRLAWPVWDRPEGDDAYPASMKCADGFFAPTPCHAAYCWHGNTSTTTVFVTTICQVKN